MKNLILVALFLGQNPNLSYAQSTAPDPLITKAKNISKDNFTADIQIFTSKIKEGICGKDGPSYIVEYQLQKWERLGPQGAMTSNWSTIKTYGISAVELAKQGTPLMMDIEKCAW